MLALSACASHDSTPIADPVDIDRSAARSVANAPQTTSGEGAPSEPSVLDDPRLNPEGVINAAVVLWTEGDVEAALLAGAFNRNELDAARAGLDDGSLTYLFD